MRQVSNNVRYHISKDESAILDHYDRLASSWASKIERENKREHLKSRVYN